MGVSAVGLSTFNILVCSWFVTMPTWYAHKHGLFRSGNSPLTEFRDTFELKTEVLKHVFHIIIIDIWFYSTHRLIHIRRPINLYKWIHKLHHKFTAPCAPACMYANPIEFCIG